MNNLSLNYTTVGQGEPLIIIHGLFGSSRNWKTLAKRFAEYFQVILLDLRNHGESPFDTKMDYQSMAEDVVAVMLQLDIQSAHILGHSMGGKVAMKLNHLHPDKVKKLVIADIAPVSYQHDYDDILDAVLGLNLAEATSRKKADHQLMSGIPDQRIRQFLLQNLTIQQGVASWNINWKALQANMSLITGFEDITHWTIENYCLFIKGELSPYVNNDHVDLIHRHFTRAEVVTLKNAGHWLHAEQPQEFFTAVITFMTR